MLKSSSCATKFTTDAVGDHSVTDLALSLENGNAVIFEAQHHGAGAVGVAA